MDLIKEVNKNKLTLRAILKNNIEDIKKVLDEGHQKKEIYNIFVEKNKIKSHYPYFLKILNQVLAGNKKLKKNKPKEPISSSFPQKKGFSMIRLSKEDF